jgi:hypothetical protein
MESLEGLGYSRSLGRFGLGKAFSLAAGDLAHFGTSLLGPAEYRTCIFNFDVFPPFFCTFYEHFVASTMHFRRHQDIGSQWDGINVQ